MNDLLVGGLAWVALGGFILKMIWRNLTWIPLMAQVIDGDTGYTKGIFKRTKNYTISYAFQGQEIIQGIATNVVCLEGQQLIMLVNPRNPNQVQPEYAGTYISKPALWIQPVMVCLLFGFLVWKMVSVLLLASESGVSLSSLFDSLAESNALTR